MGSIRRAGDRIRVTAKLIDGSNGSSVWARSYDRALSDIFAVQDEITRPSSAASSRNLVVLSANERA
jgi:TolB-like protein